MRTFERSSSAIASRTVRTYRLICSVCGVGVGVNCNKQSSLPPEVIARKFVEQGWVVGNHERHDLCPLHARRPEKPRDPELHLIDRINGAMRTLEGALLDYSKLETSKKTDDVVVLLSDFHERVFGNAI
jgi:hypothetical protein